MTGAVSIAVQPLGPLGVVGSLCRTAIFYTWSGVHLLAITGAALARPESDLWYRWARGWVRFGLGIFRIEVECEGLDRLPAGGDCVVMANHRSNFDVLAVIQAFGKRETRWVAKRELRRVPVFGLALQVTGQILIDRGNHAQAIDELRRNLGRRGASVVFFPEGHRSDGLELLRFKKGGAAFAIDAGLPVVPLAISGSECLLPRGSMTPRPGAIRLRVGEPIDISGMTADDRESLTARVRDEIDALLALVERRPAPTEPAPGSSMRE